MDFVWKYISEMGPIFLIILLYIVFVAWFERIRSKKLSIKAKHWWVITHIFFFILYFSGLLATLLLTISSTYITDPEQLYITHVYVKYADWYLIIPGAFGCIITGVWLSVRTHWGLLNYYWIIVKTLGNVIAIGFGGYWMANWYDYTIELTTHGHHNFFHNPVYAESRLGLIYGSIGSMILLGYLVIISKFKPWGKRQKTKAKTKSAMG